MDTSQILAGIDEEIDRLRRVRSLLAGITGGAESRGGGRNARVRKRKPLSKEARERIAAAQRKRWAKQKAAKK